MSVLTLRTKGGKEWIPRYVVSIDRENCIGCGRCYKVCGREVLYLIQPDEDEEDEEKAYMDVVNPDNCIGCEACSRVCPKKCFTHSEVVL